MTSHKRYLLGAIVCNLIQNAGNDLCSHSKRSFRHKLIGRVSEAGIETSILGTLDAPTLPLYIPDPNVRDLDHLNVPWGKQI